MEGTIIKLNPTIAALLGSGVDLAFGSIQQKTEFEGLYWKILELLQEHIGVGIGALADQEPNDVEQLKTLGKSLANQLGELFETIVKAKLLIIKNQDIQDTLLVLTEPAFEIVSLTTDDNPNDKSQIVNYYADFIGGDQLFETVSQKILRPGLQAASEGLRGLDN